VLIFLSKLIWQQARNSVLDAKFGSAILTTQHGVQNSIGDDPEFLGKRQFTRIKVAAEEADHIAGELINHQGAYCGECAPLLVAYTLDTFHLHFSPNLLRCNTNRLPQRVP
jgi:hypothetical protein